MKDTNKNYCYYESPVGELLLAANSTGLTDLAFSTGKGRRRHHSDWHFNETPFRQTRKQLDLYFKGKLTTFDIALDPVGTPFQLSVWHALQSIPYGCTTSYAQIAESIGNPKAMRAVGAANGQNPIAIIIPCHRVIGKSGKLVGFGGGLETKRYLLGLEQQKAQ